MRHRVHEILLVSSLYDSFILAEDGSLYESLLNEYIGLGLTHMPNITRVSSGSEALRLAREPGRFDLVITSLRLEDMHSVDLARRIREIGIDTPIVLLTYDTRELGELERKGGTRNFTRVFIWQGDFRVVLAIIKFIEDRWNISADTRLVGVQSIVLIEDSVRYYSSYLPLIYTAVLEHTEHLIAEGVNPAHKILRMRARPKIILCTSYEEAWEYFDTYHENILGVIADIEFPRGGQLDADAGFEFAGNVRMEHADIPVLLQSNNVSNRDRAHAIGASFLQKDSDSLLHELLQFMRAHFGFGDFVFRMRDGSVVGRAHDLRTLEDQLKRVPDESIKLHGERNDFSTWLKARTEFLLAYRLRPVRIEEFDSPADVRAHLVARLSDARRDRQRGSVVDFDPDTFDETRSFARVGGGSLGGKGRGLAFAARLIHKSGLEDAIANVRIMVPPSIILSTDVFDEFIEENELWDFAIHCEDDAEIVRRFRAAAFPAIVSEAVRSFLDGIHFPLSIRSSSLLEDSQFMPFAGVYDTKMVPNSCSGLDERLDEVLDAVKRVYASTFFHAARRYIKSTPYRVEEEKMAVIIQKLVGAFHNNRFYPEVSGTARSHNFYPIKPMEPGDGIAAVALGLGLQVVDGGAVVRFSPRYPRHLVQFSSVDDILKYGQKDFWALAMPEHGRREAPRLVSFSLDVAERDTTLRYVGSTYNRDNHAIYDGIERAGSRVVTFAPILKYNVVPLSAVLQRLLELGRRGMSAPVEIEFAVNLSVPEGEPAEFYLLQMRPMVISEEIDRIGVVQNQRDDLVGHSTRVLGQGVIHEIFDAVVVDIETFSRAESHRVAREVSAMNATLVDEERPYVLIGVGRWGSADPWLGIPVRWENIDGACVIVECGMRDIQVAPSQGTHFFQNITAARVGYITVEKEDDKNFIDWDWLRAVPAVSVTPYTRHIRFEKPLTIVMDGRRSCASIIKPGVEPGGTC